MGVVRETLAGFASLFGGKSGRPGRADAGRRQAGGESKGSAAAKRPSIDDRLGDMVEVTTPVAAGTVFWLGVKEFRERFGDRWNNMGPKIHAITCKCIEQRLNDAKDTYEQHGDSYAILFARLSKTEANLQCALIAKDITDRLLGECDVADMVSVGSAVVEVDQELARKISKGGGLGPLLADEGRRKAAQAKRSANDPLSPEKALADIQFVFQPMWNTRNNVISSYRCFPTRVSRAGRLLTGDALLPAWDPETMLPSRALMPLLDSFVLKKSVDLLERVTEKGHRNVMVVPVHFATLREKALRNEYKSILNTVSLDLNELLVFEILGVDDAADYVGLLEPVLHLKPSCRAVILNQPIGQKDFSGLKNMGVHSVGADVDGLNEPEATVISKLQRFAERAEKDGFRSYVHGIETLSLATAAVGAGFDFVSGMAITSIEDAGTPQGVYEFTLADLFTSAYAPADFAVGADDEIVLADGDGQAGPAASEPADEIEVLARHFIKKNGLSETDAVLLAKTKLGIAARPGA